MEVSADLIKSETPLTTAKISRMLHQLDFKLTVEKQYKEGIDKMAKLYQVCFFSNLSRPIYMVSP